ncbi:MULTISPECIES: hypothetical protein [Ruegeria]|uniref:Uncharacterized protein n=1 Tax=Ruegeria atlantica TaxID=81569 RepID=A0ABX1WBF2_9RHOB|nr:MULTISPECIES: hypothetical protein [Ruegeria]NOD30604.1 hypothetical protein [Ruegeria atlantica]
MPKPKTGVLRTTVPSRLIGKRDGLFFLWGQIERARLKVDGGERAEGAAPDGPRANTAGEVKGSTTALVDEFIFY